MKFDFIRKVILEFINTNVKPLYTTFDDAHNLAHFDYVTENCVKYAKQLIEKGEDIDLEIAYLVGALHDVGITKGRENHAKSSAEFVRNSVELSKFYNPEIIELIAQAVEDHSAHLDYEPRNIYGKIVADADRNNSVYLVLSRPLKFNLKHEPNKSRVEHIDDVYQFAVKKFGKNGYVKYWLNIPETTAEQQKIWDLLDNEEECKNYISKLYDEIINQ